MKGYWLILGTEITDEVAQDEYNRLWAPIAGKYQARLNPTKVPPLLKEARNTSRVIIAEFAPIPVIGVLLSPTRKADMAFGSQDDRGGWKPDPQAAPRTD
ncbi:MAG: hypothetical protein WA813_10280 [Beijerinckiaceae bacterium]